MNTEVLIGLIGALGAAVVSILKYSDSRYANFEKKNENQLNEFKLEIKVLQQRVNDLTDELLQTKILVAKYESELEMRRKNDESV